MQHVSTYIGHLQAKLRTVIALHGGLCTFGNPYGLQCFCCGFFVCCALLLYSTIVVLTAIYSNKVNM